MLNKEKIINFCKKYSDRDFKIDIQHESDKNKDAMGEIVIDNEKGDRWIILYER